MFSPTTKSLFLKLFLSVYLQCNFLLLFKFKTESFASGTETLRSAERKVKQRWVSALNIFSLAVHASGFRLHTSITNEDIISWRYFRLNYVKNTITLHLCFWIALPQWSSRSLAVSAGNTLVFFPNHQSWVTRALLFPKVGLKIHWKRNNWFIPCINNIYYIDSSLNLGCLF